MLTEKLDSNITNDVIWYRGKTVVVASGAPDHRAEHDAPRQNPNTRCELYSRFNSGCFDQYLVAILRISGYKLRSASVALIYVYALIET